MPCASFVCFMHSDDSGVEVHSMHAECQESEAVMVTAPLQRALRHCCFRALWQHVELLRCMCTSCATTTSSLPVSESHDPCPTCHTQPPPLCTKRAIERLHAAMRQLAQHPDITGSLAAAQSESPVNPSRGTPSAKNPGSPPARTSTGVVKVVVRFAFESLAGQEWHTLPVG